MKTFSSCLHDFRWQKISENDGKLEFFGITRNRIWKLWRERPDGIHFEILGRFSRAKNSTPEEDVNSLRDFFQVKLNKVLIRRKFP